MKQLLGLFIGLGLVFFSGASYADGYVVKTFDAKVEKGYIPEGYFFEKIDLEDKAKENGDMCSYKLKTNLDPLSGNSINIVVFLKSFVEKIFEDKIWSRDKEVESWVEVSIKNHNTYSFDHLNKSVNEYLKDIFMGSIDWWITSFAAGKAKNPFFIDIPRFLAKKFNKVARKYIKIFSKKNLNILSKDLISIAKKITKNDINKLKQTKKLYSSKNWQEDKKEFLVKSCRNDIRNYEEKIKLLKGYLKNPKGFIDFIDKKVLLYYKKTKIHSNKLIKNVEELLVNEEKLKKYIKSCISYGYERIKTEKKRLNNLIHNKEQIKKEKEMEVNLLTNKIKRLKNRLDTIEKIDVCEFEKIIKKLKMLSLIPF